jgi:pimeloyl-ACP methyl ester carboxylesterase
MALAVLLVAAGLALSTAVSTLSYLRLPEPTGASAVGRVTAVLDDPARPEPRSGGAASRRVGLVAWYPAQADSGAPASYVPDLAGIRDALAASGELSGPVVAGLAFVGTSTRTDAQPDAPSGPEGFPVVVLSPGNATNVAFYAVLAEELASHGYVVIGVDHPYQVAAVDLGDGTVAVYEPDPPGQGPASTIPRKIAERTADLAFILDRLRSDAAGLVALDGRLDLDRVAVVGHSNGGIAAAELCATDVRVAACANIDGLSAGGPFSATPDVEPLERPFLFLTKERTLHPTLVEAFESTGEGAYRVVIPAATHQGFADGARFEPRVLPLGRPADAVQQVERDVVRAFLDHELRGRPGPAFDGLTPGADLYVEAYPLGGRGTLPSG